MKLWELHSVWLREGTEQGGCGGKAGEKGRLALDPKRL